MPIASKIPTILLTATLGMVTPAAAQDDAPVPSAAFAIADRNGDGSIDRAEFDARMADVFFFADRDKDGRLTPAELAETPPDRFAAADANGDGALSMGEFMRARADDFDRADRDRDGVLSRAEVESAGRPVAQ